MQNILVPIDFSKKSFNALCYTIQLASISHANIKLLHVTRKDYSQASISKELKQKRLTTEKYFTQRMLKFASEALKHSNLNKLLATVPKIDTLLKTGTPLFSILAASDHPQIDLLVMATSGNRKKYTESPHSLCFDVVKDSACDVLIVPDLVHYHEISNMLYASNYEKSDVYHINRLLQSINGTSVCMNVLHVNKKHKKTSRNLMDKSNIEDKEKRLKYHEIESENVEESILEFAHSSDAHLVIINEIEDTVWKRLFKKSFTKRIVKLTDFPLLIIRSSH